MTDAVLHRPCGDIPARMMAAPSLFRATSAATGSRGPHRKTRDRVNFLNIRGAAAV